MFISNLLVVVVLSKLLNVVKLFDVGEVDVIGNPHVFKGLQEEAVLKLSLGEEFDEVLLFKVIGQQRNNECTFLRLLNRPASHLNEFEALLQLNVLVSVIDNLVEILHLSVSIHWLIIIGIRCYIGMPDALSEDNLSIVTVSEVKDAH